MGWSRFSFYVLLTLVISGGGAASVFGFKTLSGCLIFAGGLGMLWTVADGLWEQRNDEIRNRGELVRKRTAFGIAASQWDEETRHFLAREWPEMGVEFGESQLAYVLDGGVNTGILIPFLQAFLQDSTEQSFADVRSYNDDKSVQERFNVSRETVRTQWRKCADFLESKGYLREGSMAGNQTYKWTTPEHFKVMRRRYLNMRTLTELQ